MFNNVKNEQIQKFINYYQKDGVRSPKKELKRAVIIINEHQLLYNSKDSQQSSPLKRNSSLPELGRLGINQQQSHVNYM